MHNLISPRWVSRKVVAGIGVMAAVVVLSAAFAQTREQLQQLQQLQQQRGGLTMNTPPSVTQSETILEPTAPTAPQPVSPLETLLSERVGTPLRQFGYDQLGVGRSVNIAQVGAVQDDYVLGIGDEVVLTLRGQENAEYRTEVNRDGNVTFPKLNPVSAAGRNFGQLRQVLLAAVHRGYVSTDGFVTIGRMRQISVLVSGEVGSPGMRTLTGLSTVADAIFVSGGVRKSGSLRNVRVLRGGRELNVDLYSILIGGVRSRNITLADGDKVIVPPIGATVAITGEARRAGIYELPPGRSSISIRDAVSLASGTVVSGSYTVSLLRTSSDGRRQFLDVTNAPMTVVGDGEVVFVKSAVNVSVNQVTLQGQVRTPGLFALNRYQTLHDLLPSPDVLAPGAYMLVGIVDRIDPTTMQRVILPFSPLRVTQGKENVRLISNDVVRIFTQDDVQILISAIATPMQNPDRQRSSAGFSVIGSRSTVTEARTARENRNMALAGARETQFSDTQYSETQPKEALPGLQQESAGLATAESQTAQSAPQIGMTGSQAGLSGAISGATNSSAWQRSDPSNAGQQNQGQVNSSPRIGSSTANPTAGISRGDALGGFSREDLSFYSRMMSELRINIAGAVRDPGLYLAARGTSLSELVTAAGGFTADVDLSTLELTSTEYDNAAGVSVTNRSHFVPTAEALNAYVLKPLDDVIFYRVYSNADTGAFVTLRGEVRNPGTYAILRNERLSSVIARAGGLTPQAFPYGAVFTRLSVIAREREENLRAVSDLRSQLVNTIMRPNTSTSAAVPGDTITALLTLLSQMEAQRGVGRVSVIPDPQLLSEKPSSDILLEAGDTVTIPRRPSTVMVMGEVLQPGTFVWREASNVSDYVDQAGGVTEFADKSRIIVILPDGSARSSGMSWLSLGLNSDVPPGSAIVVFRDMSSLSSHQLIVEITAIMSQLASTAASMAVLSKY